MVDANPAATMVLPNRAKYEGLSPRNNRDKRTLIGIVNDLATIWNTEASTFSRASEANTRLSPLTRLIPKESRNALIVDLLKSIDIRPLLAAVCVKQAETKHCTHKVKKGTLNLAKKLLFKITSTIASDP
jgi:hypothetical protein